MKKMIFALLLIFMLAVGALCTAEALNFPKSSKVAMVPNSTSNYGGGLYVGSTWPNGDSFTFVNVAPATIADGTGADPIAAGGFDTVVLMTNYFNFATYWADSDFNSRITDFVNDGGKLIIYTSEDTTATEFSTFIYPFTIDTPGQTGSFSGTLTNLANDTLSANNNPADPYYVNLAAITSGTDAVGDLTVMTSYDSHWYIDLFGTNVRQVGGPGHTYAFYGDGLIIFNGLDLDYTGNSYPPNNANGPGALSMLWYNELRAQVLGPAQNVNGLTLTPATATNDVGTSHTITATVRNTETNNPIQGVVVTFTITAGPNVGLTGTATSDINGEATFTWTSASVGTDEVSASIPSSTQGGPNIVSTATKTWQAPPPSATAKHCTLKITDVANVEKINFNLGETVYIAWTADGTVDISVENDATNAVIYSATGAPATGSASFVPPTSGDYTVYVNGLANKTIDVDTFFVVPESIFGTLAALGAGFAAFGLIKLKAKKRIQF